VMMIWALPSRPTDRREPGHARGSSSRVVRLEHPEPVPDGDARRDDQEALGVASVARLCDLVEGLPGDEHRHHDGLARAGRHLQGHAGDALVVQPVLLIHPGPEVGLTLAARHLGQIDRRLSGLPLTEQHPVLTLGTGGPGPVLQQLAADRRDARIVATPPQLHPLTDVVDQRVLLPALTGDVEVQRGLGGLGG
jgi:hypothetical protein